MKKMLLLFLATFAFTQTAVAFQLNNVASNGARWRSYPVSMTLNPDNSGLEDREVLSTIQEEMAKWNTSVGTTVLEVSGLDSTAASSAMDVDGKNTIAFSVNFRSDSNGFDPQSAVAIAGQYGDGESMMDAFLLFNAEYVAWDTDTATSTARKSYRDHLPTIALHELGHVLGLGHSEDYSAIMAATRQTKVMTTLTADDIAGAKYVTGIDASASEDVFGQDNNTGTNNSSSGGCGTITTNTSGGSNGGNISGNAAIMLLPMLTLLFFRRTAISFSRQ